VPRLVVPFSYRRDSAGKQGVNERPNPCDRRLQDGVVRVPTGLGKEAVARCHVSLYKGGLMNTGRGAKLACGRHAGTGAKRA